MKLYICPYKLNFKSRRSAPSLQGALLSFHFKSDLIGYSDFLPWPQFGEKNMAQQLGDLKNKKESLRFKISKQNAQIDAFARSEKRNLLSCLKIPESHFLIEDLLSFSNEQEIYDERYKYVKIKLHPKEFLNEIKKLKYLNNILPKLKWRLDLGGSSWKLWKDHLSFLINKLDFIEDPLEKTFLTATECRLFAEDWSHPSPFKIKIAKPSRESSQSLYCGLASNQWKRIIFTHSFDHPLGQVISAFNAGKFYQNQNHLFETGAFKCFSLENKDFEFDKSRGPVFKAPLGQGFGFDEILRKQNWTRWL